MKIQHPSFPNETREVEKPEAWLAAGWLEANDSVPAPPTDSTCPTCGADGDAPCVTPSGAETSRHARRP